MPDLSVSKEFHTCRRPRAPAYGSSCAGRGRGHQPLAGIGHAGSSGTGGEHRQDHRHSSPRDHAGSKWCSGRCLLENANRTALDTAMGLRSSPKAPTFIGKAIFGSGRNVMEAQGTGREDDDSARRETTTVPIWISSFRPPTPAGATRSDPAADAATRHADMGRSK